MLIYSFFSFFIFVCILCGLLFLYQIPLSNLYVQVIFAQCSLKNTSEIMTTMKRPPEVIRSMISNILNETKILVNPANFNTDEYFIPPSLSSYWLFDLCFHNHSSNFSLFHGSVSTHFHIGYHNYAVLDNKYFCFLWRELFLNILFRLF